jgi:multidrug efflux pump subunit AcrA (membrane-fusion protein)
MEIRFGDPESAGEMSMASSQLRTCAWLLAVLFFAGTGIGMFVSYRFATTKDPATKASTRLSDHRGYFVTFKSADTYGIEASAVKTVSWHPKIFVDGRVLPNPNATLEVRAPFAGTLSADASFRLGAPVKAQDTLARFEARFSPLEKLDLKSKSEKAEAEYKGAEGVLKIRQERIERLTTVQSSSISRGNLDEAAVQFAEARMQKDIALTQWTLWKQALESAGKKSIVVPINAPITGEIAEIGAQPGANVEAGQLLVRLVDFRRVLIRLDFPLLNTNATQPTDVEVETPASLPEKSARWRAHLRGPAANIEIGLQKASYLYEVVPQDRQDTPNWRPGLYVKAILDDPATATQPAKAIPASALVVHLGRTWVYLPREPKRYERREVKVLDRVGDMLYVSADGWRTNEDRVVTKNAQILLSEEFRSDVDDD